MQMYRPVASHVLCRLFAVGHNVSLVLCNRNQMARSIITKQSNSSVAYIAKRTAVNASQCYCTKHDHDKNTQSDTFSVNGHGASSGNTTIKERTNKASTTNTLLSECNTQNGA